MNFKKFLLGLLPTGQNDPPRQRDLTIGYNPPHRALPQPVPNKYFPTQYYKIHGKKYSIPELARWAQKNIRVKNVPIEEILRREIYADQLFNNYKGNWLSRAMASDLSYPILILQHQNGSWEIMDGNHRTWKAWKTGVKEVGAYVIPIERLVGEIKPMEDKVTAPN